MTEYVMKVVQSDLKIRCDQWASSLDSTLRTMKNQTTRRTATSSAGFKQLPLLMYTMNFGCIWPYNVRTSNSRRSVSFIYSTQSIVEWKNLIRFPSTTQSTRSSFKSHSPWCVPAQCFHFLSHIGHSQSCLIPF